jgi:hypothetical protein
VLLSEGRDAKRWSGNAHFRVFRDAADHRVTIRIDPLTERDLYLLSPSNVARLLGADQECFSLHPSKSEIDGLFIFPLRESEEQRLKENSERSSHLYLGVARREEEE